MQLAHQELRDNNVASTVALLKNTRAEFRGWEWRYLHRLCHPDLLTKEHLTPVLTVSFSPDGSRVVSGAHDGTVRVWDVNTGTDLFTLAGEHGDIRSSAFSRDGSMVVICRFDTRVRVCDARNGAVGLDIKEGHTLSCSAAFSPDGSRIVTGGNDNIARIWDTAAGAKLLSLKGNTGPVYSVEFSSDGTRLLTGSGGSVMIWDSRPFPPPGPTESTPRRDGRSLAHPGPSPVRGGPRRARRVSLARAGDRARIRPETRPSRRC